ncbi:FAD-binding oxidoreductase [Streptomyces sp. HC44]|uniref:L-gulonolactone oxidase n=2 Tax=Streptomyces scabichelini TaxID=2711217 RepID=A0A6G4V8K2_9ACTN|nr:FAD-binding oxidoreductase [Streptomyces scabichelini]
MPMAYEPSSHETFTHDSLASLAYDWERVGDPGVDAKWPGKVLLPRGTADVVRAVREARGLDEKIVIRGSGHSSNNLVTADGGTLLLTTRMNRIVEVDDENLTCTLQPGALLAQVDEELAKRGLGLSIIGDHNHITAAGFASVGGISPASHRFGLFLDTVTELEYVDWEGDIHQCSREQQRDRFLRVLAGTGRHGVITSLTVRIIRVDKFRTVLANNRFITTDFDEFVERSARLIRDPGDALMERGAWADLPLPVGSMRIGQFSSYHETEQNPLKSLYDRIAYGYQQFLGYWAGRLPSALDEIVKYVGMGAILVPPRFGTAKNIERFTDQILDSTVGDPTRMFIVLAPVEHYETLLRELSALCLRERRASGAVTFVSVYVKAVRSEYLSGPDNGDEASGRAPKGFCELMLYLGVDPQKMTGPVLRSLVSGIDELAVRHQAFRYMHSLTSEDPAIRRKVDPNALYDPEYAQETKEV